MNQAKCAIALLGVVLAFAEPAWGVVLGSGSNGNTTAASLTSAGGPGNPALPGFSNVGISPTGGASVTYLGNGWGITAAHVVMKPGFDTVKFGASTYNVDLSSIHVLHNPDSSLADLKLFHITGAAPALPSITASLMVSSSPGGRQIMIGNGANTVDPKFWHVDKTNPSSWVWNEQSPPSSPGVDDYAGYTTGGSNTIRWGENNVSSTGVFVETFVDSSSVHYFVNGFVTTLSNLQYTGVTPLASEAQGSVGDSGGAVYTFSGGQWKLSGIMVATGRFDMTSNRPDPTEIYGDVTVAADLSIYRNEILAIVPEPASVVLGLSAVGALAVVVWRRRKSRADG